MTPRPITADFIGRAFPSFYAESAYYTGAADAAQGHADSAACYIKHGEPEPTGMRWYRAGLKA